MFKTQVEPRAAGERKFTAKFRFVFCNNMEKTREEFPLFSVEKARALHLTSFLLSVLLLTIATSHSARRNLDSYCKIINI